MNPQEDYTEENNQEEVYDEEYLTVPLFEALQRTMMDNIAALISSEVGKLKLQDQNMLTF